MTTDFLSKTKEQLEKTLLELEENVSLVRELLTTIESRAGKLAKKDLIPVKQAAAVVEEIVPEGFSTTLINILQKSGKQMKSAEVVRVAENLGLHTVGRVPFPQRVRGELGRLANKKRIRRIDTGVYAI